MQHNRSIILFLWHHIKPYKWLYMVMLMAPVIGAIYPFTYHYAIKLFVDKMSTDATISYSDLLFPITLLLFSQLVMEAAWRIADLAELKAEPYVRRSLLLKSYDYIQHHSYSFFQDNFTGTISSKVKGILDGYDHFWAEMHHGISQRILKIVISFCVLAIVHINLSLFICAWAVLYFPIMYRFSIKLNHLSFDETESRHRLIGQISDKITNIIAVLSFASRKIELKNLDKQISNDFLPKQILVYKYSLIGNIISGVFFLIMMLFFLFYMVHLRIHNLITVGDFTFVFGIAIVIIEEAWAITQSMQDVARTIGDLRSSISLLYTPQIDADPQNAKILKIIEPKI